jgi:hypothetical protein
VIEWILKNLAERLGVKPPNPGESYNPTIRYEQPWSQWSLVLVVIASVALIIWLYRNESRVNPIIRGLLAGIRITLVLLALFMLSEAVLSVQRVGKSSVAILIDDSASQRIADQYDNPEDKIALETLAAAGSKAPAKPPTSTDTPSETTRLDLTKGLILKDDARLIRELQKQQKVRVYLVSNSVRTLTEVDKPEDIPAALDLIRQVQPTGSQTRLGDGLRQVLTELRGAEPTATLLYSDGQTTEGEALSKAAELANRKGVKLFTIGVGSAQPARDLELTELLVDDVVFVDDIVRFQAKLSARGFAGEKVTLRLKEADPSSADPIASAREIAVKEVDAPKDGKPERVELVHSPRATGERTFILEVDPRPRELQTDNNRIQRVITVRKEKLKVLLVDTEPRYEFRYLKNYLERDETIDLNVVLLSSDPYYSDQDRSALPTFPAAKDDLFAYDVVLFGDTDISFLSQTQMQNLVEFVTVKGGGLLFIAGELFNPTAYRGSPIEILFPIELSDARNPTSSGQNITAFRPELTLEGRSSPIFRFGDNDASSAQIWQELPELFWYIEAPRKKPLALVLAEHPSVVGSNGRIPLIVYQFLGAGKTMFHAFDDTWRWRFRAGDKYFGRFWVQTVRFLARSKLAGQRQAEIQTDRQRYERGQPILIRVRFPNPGLAPTAGDLTVQIDRKGQGPRKLALSAIPGSRNLFEGALPQALEGDYEVRLLPPPVLQGPMPTTSFRVEAPINEFQRIEMNQTELARGSEITGGKFYTPLTADTLLADLPKPVQQPLDTDPPIALWNTWPILSLFLMLIIAEWVIRKRNQMV